MSQPTDCHYIAIKRLLRSQWNLKAWYSYAPFATMDLMTFIDVDWGSCIDDRKNTSVFCVFFGDNQILWKYSKQKVLAHLSTESKYRALASANNEILWMLSPL